MLESQRLEFAQFLDDRAGQLTRYLKTQTLIAMIELD